MFARAAMEWIDMEMKVYSDTMKVYMKEDAKAKLINKNDQDVRLSIETSEVTQTLEDVIKAAKFKLRRDIETHRKLMLNKHTCPPP